MTDGGPHVRYLLFSWLGVVFGLYLGWDIFEGDALLAIIWMFVALFICLAITIYCQDRWLKKQKDFYVIGQDMPKISRTDHLW